MSTLVYDFTSADTGEVDQETGALRYSPDGYHLLSRLTLQALDTGVRSTPCAQRRSRRAPGSRLRWPGLRFTLA